MDNTDKRWLLCTSLHIVGAVLSHAFGGHYVASIAWTGFIWLVAIRLLLYYHRLSQQHFDLFIVVQDITYFLTLNFISGGSYSTVVTVLAAIFSSASSFSSTRAWYTIATYLIIFSLSLVPFLYTPISFIANNTEIFQLFCVSIAIFRTMVEINIIKTRNYLLEKLAKDEKTKNSLFVATISHELRTPLASIIGWTDMILHSYDLPQTTKHQVEIIKTSGNHLLLLVNDILDFAKLDNEKFIFEKEPYDLRRLLESTTDYMTVLMHEGVDYKLKVNLPTVQHVIGDSHRLLQCLTNLLSNAAKFTAKGCISLHCTEGTTEQGLTRINFTLTDTGCGISKKDIGRIFMPFVQAEDNNGHKYGGTGLGLVITRQLIMKMKGDIEVKSEVGVKTTFSFYVQLKCCSKKLLEKHLVKIDNSWSPGNFRVLLAEDNILNQKLIKTQLEKLGHVCVIAKDGQEAVSFASGEAIPSFSSPSYQHPTPDPVSYSHSSSSSSSSSSTDGSSPSPSPSHPASYDAKFDIILMDIQMPRLSGPEAAKRIREGNGPNKNTTIIALSAMGDLSTRSTVLESGMDDLLTKPATLDELSRKILQVHLRQIRKTLSNKKRYNPMYNSAGNIINTRAEDNLDRTVRLRRTKSGHFGRHGRGSTGESSARVSGESTGECGRASW